MLQEDDTPQNIDAPPPQVQEEEVMDIAGVIKGEGLETIRKSAKQLVQLTWTDIVIKAMPSQNKCFCCKSGGANMLTEEKIIIDHVHGTV